MADSATSSVNLLGSYLGGFFMSAVVLELSKYRSLLSHVERIRRPRKKLYYLPMPFAEPAVVEPAKVVTTPAAVTLRIMWFQKSAT